MINSITTATMKFSRRPALLFVVFFSLLSYQAKSQTEICDNGIDDDGDGFVDCYDGGDCAGSNSCTEFYFGNSVLCQDEPTENPTFSIRQEWGSEDQSASSLSTPVVGDIDQDGTPEILVPKRYSEDIVVIDGVSGAVEFKINLGWRPESTLAIGNIEDDDCAEIFVFEFTQRKIASYDCEGNLNWEKSTSINYPAVPSLADFDGDGNVELYFRNEIRDAATGNVLVAGSGNWGTDYAHAPLAIDMNGDGQLELITGHEIWEVNLAGGSLIPYADMNDDLTGGDFFIKSWSGKNRTGVSAADFDLDGDIDILISGAYGSSSADPTTVFFWDVSEGTVKTYADPSNDHNKGTGRINIGDTDGDGYLNATYVSDQKLYSLEINRTTGNLEPIWIKGIDEGTSGFTGCTLFDFNGDGAFETIYRSESTLHIINGSNGTSANSITCISRTQEEYPIVADVDGDGASEICVTCYTSNSTPFSPLSNTQYSQVRIYGADNEIWQPARSVWNQHAYYNVNVNDDLTIPSSQQDHTRVFSDGECSAEFNNADGKNRVLNTFLNQSPIVESNGCPSYVSPDIVIDGSSIVQNSLATCPEAEFEIEFSVQNQGDTKISGTLPVTFYDGDPETADATKLNTQYGIITNLDSGDYQTFTMTVEGSGGNFDLYVSINDYGQTPPITPGLGNIPECEEGNNIVSFSVESNPFPLTANALLDNRKCDPSKPDNGSGEAYFDATGGAAIGGGEETIWFEDFSGINDGETEETTGDSQWSSADGGSTPRYYGITDEQFHVNKSGNKKEKYPVTWTSESIDISGHTDIELTLDLISSGPMEESGDPIDRMVAYYSLDGGGQVKIAEGFGDFGLIQANASGLNGSTIQVIVTMHTNGKKEHHYLDNIVVKGTTPPVSAIFNEDDGYVFNWYEENNFTNLISTGSAPLDLVNGNYSVVGYNPDANCYSDTVNITIGLVDTASYFAHVYELHPYTDCANDDGQLRAFAYTQVDGSGDPLDTLYDGYTFEWRLGGDPFGPLLGTGDTLSFLENGNYGVTIYETISGCTATELGSVSSSVTATTEPNVTVTHITSCGGTGEAAADVGGNTTDYSFEWFVGESLKPTPDFTTPTIINLDAGTYIVRAVSNANSCESDTVTVVVEDNSTGPKPDIVLTPTTSCDDNNANGSAKADEGSPGSGYTYTWYSGTSTTNANKVSQSDIPGEVNADGNEATNLPDGLYTLTVKKGGCTVTKTIEILNEAEAPSYNFINSVGAGNAINLSDKAWIEMNEVMTDGWDELTISYWAYLSNENYLSDHLIFYSGSSKEDNISLWTDNTYGLAFVVRTDQDGQFGRINTNYKPTGWTQLTGVWAKSRDLNGDGIVGDMMIYADGVLLGTEVYEGNGNGLAGEEMYFGKDRNLGTNKFEGRLDELRIYNKAFTPTEINAAVCEEITDPDQEPNLIIYYDFDGLSGVNNGDVIPNVATGLNTGVTNNGESGAFFNGEFRDQGNGSAAFVTSNINCPLGFASNNTSCDSLNANGSVDLTGKVDPNGGNYKYILYEGYGAETKLDSVLSPNTPEFTGLASGFYAIETIDVDSDCSTGLYAFAIANASDEPTIIATVTDDNGCNTTGNGEINIKSTSDNGEPAAGYTYEFYYGATFDSLLSTETVLDGVGTGFTYSNLTDGTYRVKVTNNDILCSYYEDVIVDDISVALTVTSVAVFDDTYCGSDVGLINVEMPGDDAADYTYAWYTGSTVNNDSLIVGETGDELTARGAGQYTFVATHNSTGCSTSPETRTINEDIEYPDVTVRQLSAATGCIAGQGGGEIDAFVQKPADPNTYIEPDYSFEWYSDAGFTSLVASTSTATNLNSGTFYLVVTDNTTGCVTDNASISVGSAPIQPIVTLNDTTSNTGCATTSYNGEILLNIEFDGSNVTNPSSSGYTFVWEYSDNTTVSDGGTISGANTENPTGLPGDTYTVTVTAPNGCSSDPFNITLNDVPNGPDFTITNNEPSTGCLVGNGRLTANISGNASDYTFEWFLGSSTNAEDTLPGPANGNAFYVNDEVTQIGGLDFGVYTLRLTDNSNGCSTTLTQTVADSTENPLLVDTTTIVSTNQTTCDPTNYGGSIDISSIVQTTQKVLINNINGSFEDPDIRSVSNHTQSWSGGTIKQFRIEDIDGWSTTESDAIPEIEIWHKNNSVRNHDAYEGDQWAEINADQDAGLYFDLNTIPTLSS